MGAPVELRVAAAHQSVLCELGQRLRAAGYTEANLQRLLGQPLRLGVAGLSEVLRRRLEGEGPRRTLFRLFWLGSAVTRAEADAALAPLDVDVLARAGFVESADGDVTARVGIGAHAGLLVAHDPGRVVSLHPVDFVPGVSGTSSLFDRLTIRRRVATALDLGTGCGVQALLASRHAGSVTAVDVNARAIEYATANASLNGIGNVRVRHGSWFEPVAGERFDLVLGNLPFVISPQRSYLYRDGGRARDELARDVVSAVPDHLEEGGLAQLFCDWVVSRGDDWRRPVESWLEQGGCDAVLLLHGRHDPLSYAARWNHPLDEESLPAFVDALGRWLAYYRGEAIEEIADGMVVLRRRSGGRNFVRGLEVPGFPRRPAGEHVHRLFTGYDVIRGLAEPADVLELALSLPGGGVVDVRWVTAGDRLVPGGARIGLQDGAGFSAATTSETAEVLRACDGSRSLGELVEAAASAHAVPYEELAPAVAAEAVRLVGLGFLVVRSGS